MVKLYGNGLIDELETYRVAIHRNVSETIYELCLQSVKLSNHDDVKQNTLVTPENEEARQLIVSLGRGNANLDNATIEAVKRLWQDPGIQATYEHRHMFQLYDSAQFFLDKVEEVLKPDYAIAEDDILRTRIRTTGMIEKLFMMGDNFQMRLVDVGGQRSERKKWMKWFDGVTAVMFVTAISEYNQVCFEDEVTNRMDESFSVFKEMVNSQWFKNTSFILFLNKRDLFVEKLEKFPLHDRFPEYQPTNEPDSALEFVEHKFLDLIEDRQSKTVFPHFTTATDSDIMSKVLDGVKHTLLKRALQQTNLM